MEGSLEKNNGLSNSGEVPVDFEVEIEGKNGNQTDTETDDNSITVGLFSKMRLSVYMSHLFFLILNESFEVIVKGFPCDREVMGGCDNSLLQNARESRALNFIFTVTLDLVLWDVTTVALVEKYMVVNGVLVVVGASGVVVVVIDSGGGRGDVVTMDIVIMMEVICVVVANRSGWCQWRLVVDAGNDC
ncbi:hypothetical protein CQW23_28373 [Capsicum baccatum]|uniref:Uncharacterized protein n=1 Tax=Capsicum baccatum TaxID=33114 RepID=A0A2G2VGD1_CAPBA|nr:hypothetical protein CQW23_28373 [Capsicum baccatum]